MTYCKTCRNDKKVDVRQQYKHLHDIIIAEYAPLYIDCPACSKDYSCKKCNSTRTELMFSKIALNEHDDAKIIVCLNCDYREPVK